MAAQADVEEVFNQAEQELQLPPLCIPWHVGREKLCKVLLPGVKDNLQ